MCNNKSPKLFFTQLCSLIICVLLFSVTAFAHSGRTDANGGHHDRKNGGYHYHNGGSSGSSSGGGSSSSNYTPYIPPATSVSISSAPSEINIGDNSEIEYSVENASGSSVQIISSNPEIVRVNEDNTLSGIGVGTATITISVNGVSKSINISVNPVLVESIDIKYEADMQLDKSQNLKATLAPQNATDKTITWKSSNPDIVEVSDKGALTAKSVGTRKSIFIESENWKQLLAL